MNEVELSLPEWVFLDGTSHLGNMLAGRDVLQHIPSFTIIELFNLNGSELIFSQNVKTRAFSYKNRYDEIEDHVLAVHFSIIESENLDSIIDKAILFYCEFLDWEDQSIIEENTSKQN